jgi:hypothetical protein
LASALKRFAATTAIAIAAASCAAGAPASVGSPTASAIVVTLDLQRFFAANGATFEPQDAPANVHITADAALAIVRAQVTGTPTQTSATFGRLRDPQLGVRSDRLAWLVTIDGAAPPRQSPGGPAPGGPMRTMAFIDAEDGRDLEMLASGAGP